MKIVVSDFFFEIGSLLNLNIDIHVLVGVMAVTQLLLLQCVNSTITSK